MLTDAQKKARNKWDANNMAVLSCKVRKELAERAKAKAKEEGTSINAIMAQALRRYIEEDSNVEKNEEN